MEVRLRLAFLMYRLNDNNSVGKYAFVQLLDSSTVKVGYLYQQLGQRQSDQKKCFHSLWAWFFRDTRVKERKLSQVAARTLMLNIDRDPALINKVTQKVIVR